jgi:hypothetical protein
MGAPPRVKETKGTRVTTSLRPERIGAASTIGGGSTIGAGSRLGAASIASLAVVALALDAFVSFATNLAAPDLSQSSCPKVFPVLVRIFYQTDMSAREYLKLFSPKSFL